MEIRNKRWPSDAKLVIEHEGSRYMAVVSDVSEGGLKLRAADFDPAPGDMVRIVAGSSYQTGHVRWARGRVFGLYFRPALSADLLGHLTGGLYRPHKHPGRGDRGHTGHLTTM